MMPADYETVGRYSREREAGDFVGLHIRQLQNSTIALPPWPIITGALASGRDGRDRMGYREHVTFFINIYTEIARTAAKTSTIHTNLAARQYLSHIWTRTGSATFNLLNIKIQIIS